MTCHLIYDKVTWFRYDSNRRYPPPPSASDVLTNLGLRIFRIVVKVMMRATVGRVKMEDG